MPRTMAEWNILPATIREAPYVDTFKASLCSIKLSIHFTILLSHIRCPQHACSYNRLSRMWITNSVEY